MDSKQLAQYIDHTALTAEKTEQDILKLCDEAIQYGFYSVCINSGYIPLAKEKLAGSNVKICTVVGFPLGANLSSVKAFETQEAINAGAGEINQHIRVVQGDVCIVGYFHAGFDAQRKARIQAQYARACAVQRAHQDGVGIGFHGLNQRSAHAPVCARNGDFQLCHDVLLILQFVETQRFAHARSPKRCLQCG